MWFYRFAKGVCAAAFWLAFRVEYEGKENIPAGGGYLLISNHQQYLDPVFLAIGLREQVRFMAKAELFKSRFWEKFFLKLGVFPVYRGTGDTDAVERATEIVKTGGILGIFPEGTRSVDGTPLRPKSGAAHIAKQGGADVLPACIVYEGKLRFRSKIIIRYGQLIRHEELGFEGQSASELKKATRLMFDRVLTLYGYSAEQNTND